MEDEVLTEKFKLQVDKKEILNLLEYDEKDIVFISGSIVEGISNKYSDLDVYVIKSDFSNMNLSNMDYVSDMNKSQFGQLSNGIRCDIEYWSLSTVTSLISKIKAINFEDLSIRTLNQIDIKNCSTDELASFIHRFVNSYPIYNEEDYKPLKEQLDLNKFCKLMARKHINSMDNKYEDVIGNMESNSKETALISARNLLFELMAAYIFSEKHTIDRTKWIFEKLKIIADKSDNGKEILEQFKKLYCYCQLNDEKDILENVESILNFSNKVLEIIEDDLGGI